MAAGHVLIVALVGLMLWTLLDADALRRSAEAGPPSMRRSISLAFLQPLAAVSKLVFLDRAGDGIESALGRDPNAAPGGPDASGGSSGIQVIGGHGPLIAPSVGPTVSPPVEPTPNTSPTKVNGGNLPPLRTPTRDNPLRVLVVGDSFGGDLAIGMERNLDLSFVLLAQDWQISTGLSNSKYVNWQPRIRADVRKFRPDVVAVMIGGNDFLPVQLPNGSNVSFSHVSEWKPAYSARVRRFISGATSTGARLLWVGLPIMGSATYSHIVERLNAMYARVTAHYPNATYIDTWDLFADKNGHYAAYLPDANGNLQQVRRPDNEHIATAGNDRLARYAIKVMRHVWHLSRKAMRS
jgi:uncharacterized protein